MLDQRIEKGSSFIRMQLSRFGIAAMLARVHNAWLASTAKQIFPGIAIFVWSSTDLLTGMTVDAQPLLDPIRRFESRRSKMLAPWPSRSIENAKLCLDLSRHCERDDGIGCLATQRVSSRRRPGPITTGRGVVQKSLNSVLNDRPRRRDERKRSRRGPGAPCAIAH